VVERDGLEERGALQCEGALGEGERQRVGETQLHLEVLTGLHILGSLHQREMC
jgi:hypothetical protein